MFVSMILGSKRANRREWYFRQARAALRQPAQPPPPAGAALAVAGVGGLEPVLVPVPGWGFNGSAVATGAAVSTAVGCPVGAGATGSVVSIGAIVAGVDGVVTG